MRRYEIESIYMAEVNRELLAINDAGRFREKVKVYEMLMSTDEDLEKLTGTTSVV